MATLSLIARPGWAFGPEEPQARLHTFGTQSIIAGPPATDGQTDTAVGSKGVSRKTVQATGSKSRAWQNFLARMGRGWSVRWNSITGTPSSVVGHAMSLATAEKLTSRNIDGVCLDFVAANADLLKVGPDQLELANKAKAEGRWHISFRQVHKGVPVLGSRLRVSFNRDDKVVMFGSDVYPDVDVGTKPIVDQEEALRLARADCEETAGPDRINDAELCILPLTRPKGFEYRLCWKLHIFQPEIHKKWQYLIDANSGVIVGKSDALVYQNVTGNAKLEYKPEFAGDVTCVGPFSYGNVTARGPEVVLAFWNFDSDPGWSAEGEWAFGEPNGEDESYCVGPNSAYTGNNIYGYNLEGEYPNDIQAQYLVTTPVDCSGSDNVHLKFRRWLSVESSLWDNASVEVSNDGVNWVTIWANGISRMCDWYWVSVSYDISSVAAFEPAVYIRWVMGPTDESVTYDGWNIDDVRVVSFLGGFSAGETQVDGSYSVLPPWSPCAVTSELTGAYCSVKYDCNSAAVFVRDGVEAGQVADFTWDSNWYNEIVESSVYWHTNRAHDYYVAIDPSLREQSAGLPSGLDYAMPARVQAGCPYGFCGAYWDGKGMTFGAGDGRSCDDFGLYSDVIYHEYTHAVTSKVYGGVALPYFMESGALNEGWSDYFACLLSPSQEPLIGDGGLLLEQPEGFRTLDNGFRRETDFTSTVHFDSQMVSGSLWEIRQNIGMSPELWDTLAHFARYDHPQTFEEYLVALLLEDDTRFGDGYLANSTPHGETIFTAFGNHGIGGLQYIAPSIVIGDDGGNSNGRLEPGENCSLSLSLFNGWADATNISAVLESADAFVSIIKARADFHDAQYGEITDNNRDPFVVLLNPLCPETHTISFTLRLGAAGSYDYSRTCLFTYPVAFAQSAYDDGQVDNTYLGYGLPDGGLAVRITPDSYPAYPIQLRLFPKAGEDASTIAITVWDDDGPDCLPGTILGSFPVDIRTGGDWLDVDISSLALAIDSGSFYVGWIEGDTHYYNGADTDPPYYDRSWVYFNIRGAQYWMTFPEVGFLANLMLRVRYFHTSDDGAVENQNKGRRYDSIQYAIYDADSGDEIVIRPGVYKENISTHGKNLTVRSIDPEDPAIVAATIIDGGYNGPAISFDVGEDSRCIVAGLTITGGTKNVDNDGGISCLDLGQTGPIIRNCVIAKNRGPGIYANNSSPTVVKCDIVENEEDGVRLRSNSCPKVNNCTIGRNGRNGIAGGYPEVVSCTIVRNAEVGVYHSRPVIANSIVRDNSGANIERSAEITYSNVEGGWPGLGNIDVDPCFAAPGAGDYHLRSEAGRWAPNQQSWVYDAGTSLCIDAGNPGSPLGSEADHQANVRVNMGAYGGTAQASRTPVGWSLLADLTNDGIVDFVDLGYWAENWLGRDFGRPADFDRNAVVNMPDYALLADDWFSETLWHE